jgi:hypothetical protein
MVAYLFGNPHLFISQTTFMTTGLLLVAAVVSVLPQRRYFLPRLAPTLAVILTYFGIGSMILSTEIIIRFHSTIPIETEIQFMSGLGHLLEAAVGIAILVPYLRARTRAEWLWGHNVALGYWTFQVAVLTPPWFAFQGQREIVLLVVLIMLAIAATLNVLFWRRAPRP